jgi:hypothetical protein
MNTHIKTQSHHFLVLSLAAIVMWTSCQKDQATNDDLNNIKTELRVTDWCDGTPMAIPPTVKPNSTYFVDDTCCCFTLQFSPVYLLGYKWQIIGVDNDRTYAKYNGACGELTGNFDNYEVMTCINTRATHITVTLFYPWLPLHAYCTMLPLPCKL